ncbi:MAG: aminoacyl-tRNA hydrolase [Lachnospiraceae bacterium]|nr:aminoacyl-tRNA hydrolase [Lachnospiraceae bacterium]
MYIIVGLGNPDRQYLGTRHNMGFSVIDALAEQYHIKVDTKKHKGLIGSGVIEGHKVVLVKPLTYMNLSGECVREVLDFYKVSPEELLVIYDDISLPPGQLRLRAKGSAGGHNGIKNIILHLGTDTFPRIKVGVGEKPAKMDLKDYVLGHFHGEDRIAAQDGITDACAATAFFLENGMEKTMNRFNVKKQK